MNSAKRSIKKLSTTFIIFALILTISNIAIEEIFYGDKAQKVALENGIKKTKEREGVLKNFVDDSKQTLYSLRDSITFKNFIQTGENKKLAQKLFVYTTKINSDFMQLRYIDKDGMEIIRVDRKNESRTAPCTTCNELQDKSDRYYFKDSKNKELNEVWFSAIDLNKERGKIEIPHKPTIRAILPLEEDGEFNGIIIINYFMESFLKKFTRAPLYDMILFDNDGYTLYHYDKSKSWGNFSDPKYNISSEFPEYFEQIKSSKVLHTDKFVSRKFDIEIYNGVNILLQLNSKHIEKQTIGKYEEYIVKSIIILILSFVLIGFIIKIFSTTLLNLRFIENINKNLEKKVEEKTNQITSILDLQDNIVLTSNKKEITFANKKFFSFLGYKDLESFKKKHISISELFIKNERYFYPKKLDHAWIEEIDKLPQSEKIVAIMGNDFHIHAFSVSINKFEENSIIVLSDISQTMAENIKLEDKLVLDKLTNAYNREYFDKNYQTLIETYTKEEHKLGLALLDIDHFKIVNDTYGHDVGDEVLKYFVNVIKKNSREKDILIRWGGEEFIMLFKVKTKEDLDKLLETLRETIENQNFPTVGQKTCSIGATIYLENEDILKTIKRADEAVYEAKESGRNKVITK